MKRKICFWSVILITVLCSISSEVLAQGCAMCGRTAANLDNKAAASLNTGILYLAAIPLLFLLTIGFLWWKYHKRDSKES